MLKKANIQWSGKQLAKSIEKGTINFDNAVQRTLVWDDNRKSLLIHSMIEGYPIPAFFAAKDENGIYSMLDGRQRSDAVYKYINNQFELANVPEITLESGDTLDINGMAFANLPEEVQDRIRDYSLTVYYFDGITDEEINEMFFRLNNGKPLSAIELTRVKARSIEKIKEIGKHDIFTSTLTEKSINKYTNEDIVIKSWAVLNSESPNFETKNIRPLIEQAEITDEHQDQIVAVYDKVLAVYTLLSGTGDKQDSKVAKRLITRTHLISIVPTIAHLVETEEWNIEQFSAWVRHFFSGKKSATISEVYNEAAKSGSGKPENVKRRLEAIKDSFKRFVLSNKAA